MSDEIYRLIYPGWGRTEAEADWRATGGSKWAEYQQRQAGPSAEEIRKATEEGIYNAAKKQVEEETKFLEQYKSANPFVFDEELARQSALKEYEPYYSELLKDYVGNLELQRQTTRGEANLLTKLHELDTGTRTRNYEQAVRNAEEGYAGRGMFFSGARNRAVGGEEIAYKTGMEEAEGRYETGQAGYQRQLGQYNTLEEQKKRDIGRQQQEAIEGGILTREKEAIQGYNVPFEQAYYRQFGSGSDRIRGYTIPEYY